MTKFLSPRPGLRVLDVGCGNGFFAGQLLEFGCKVTGIDLSESGIAQARAAFPTGRFEVLAADANILDALAEAPFDAVVSTEVIEHLYDPAAFARGCWNALRPGGVFVCSTPYHGYLKNLVMALTNRFDRHFDPLWLGGHIKHWSQVTLTRLLLDTGFSGIRFVGAGRVPFLWKSMIARAIRPAVVGRTDDESRGADSSGREAAGDR